MTTDRRTFLRHLSRGALAASLPASIAKALAIPAHHAEGSIADVEHIVVLMQENRSFDHYFGTLRGVRGFGDPRAVSLPDGNPVWCQPNVAGYVLPFHPSAPNLGLQFLEDLPHDWKTTQAAWNQGRYDQWVSQKGTSTMAHLTRSDIPFHYALADAFTICDGYHCSVLGPTDPNRYHLWTGWVGNDGKGGGPVLDTAEVGYDWSTYPERLQKAGVSWKIYQDIGLGLEAEHAWGQTKDAYMGNYGDNALLYFRNYQNAQRGSALHDKARTGTHVAAGGTLFEIFQRDVRANKLPQVSWIVAPEAYSEHPNWPANYGAWYISQMLDALTANPEVWSKTVLFLMYDENDGFFDHMVPPTPPPSRSQGLSTVDTTHEIFAGNSDFPAGPYGLGPRVPMIVISPWSKGGWVNSQVFDHTSIIQFIEQRFGRRTPSLLEQNITPWRRAVTGDLTSAFDFATPNNAKTALPSTVTYLPADQRTHPDYKPAPPAQQALPAQEPGMRPARALPYEVNVHAQVDFANRAVDIDFSNSGKATAVFQVRSGNTRTGPWTYTVGPNAQLSDRWVFTSEGQTAYDLSVYGPNGFLRAFKGSTTGDDRANLEVASVYDAPGSAITLRIRNGGAAACNVHILDVYTQEKIAFELASGASQLQSWQLQNSFGWYEFVVDAEADATFQQRLAGHVETGADSMSDPAFGIPRRDSTAPRPE